MIPAASDNPLRKHTLLGIAPVLPAQAKPAEAAPAQEPAKAAIADESAKAGPADEPASSVSSISTSPAAIATDAPTTSDVAPLTTASKAAPGRAEAPRAAAALSISHDDLPELKPARSRGMWLLGVAAVIALGVVGLRQLDRAPTPVPAELARPVGAAKATNAVPKSDDDEDHDGNVPNTGADTQPEPIPPEPEPVKAQAKANDAKPGGDSAAASAPTPSEEALPAGSAAPAPTGPVVRINITSDPPGARLFWKGKEQGTTPFVLEFPAGKRHSYELGLPGYTVRKVVIDGTKTDINIGMRPDPAASSGAKPRK